MGYKPSPEQVNSWMSGIDLNKSVPKEINTEMIGKQVKNESIDPNILTWLNEKAKSFNRGFESTGIPALASGYVRAHLKGAENLVNLPGEASNYFFGTSIPQLSIADQLNERAIKNLPKNPTNSALGFVGNLAGDLALGGYLYGTLGKALNYGPKTSLKMRSLLGAATGGALSGEDEPGGRLTGAVVGGAIPPVLGVSKSTIGKRAKEIAGEAETRYSKLYDKILEEAEKSGASEKIKIPSSLKNESKDLEKFYKNTPLKFNDSIKRFSHDPSVGNAHKAQSDIGKMVREFNKKLAKGQSLSSSQHDALSMAKDLQKRIRGSLHSSFTESGIPELSAEYGQATRGYAKEVGPYKTPEMAKYRSGKTGASKAAKGLIKSSKFSESEAAKELPGYRTRRTVEELPSWAKKYAMWSLATSSLPALYAAGVPVPNFIRKLLQE